MVTLATDYRRQSIQLLMKHYKWNQESIETNDGESAGLTLAGKLLFFRQNILPAD